MEGHRGGCHVNFYCSSSDEGCKESISAMSLCSDQLISNKADVNSACFGSLNVGSQCVQNLTASNL